jgi:long-chain acyl-CoA synthetase
VLLPEFLEESVARHPDKTALVCDGRRLSYRDVDDRANRLARALAGRGVQRGDRVAIVLENSAEAVIALFAALKADGVFVLLNPTTKAEKLGHILDHCRASALVGHVRRLDTIRAGCRQAPSVRTVFLDGAADAAGPAEVPGAECVALAPVLMGDAPGGRPARRSIDIDLAALVYTSGSTGGPKGVMLTHRNMVAAATSITTYLDNRPDDVILNVLPLAFDYGLYQVLMAFRFGGTVVLERSFAFPHLALQKIPRERVTGFPIVPTISALLLQMDLGKYDLSTVRYLTNTGAPLPVEHIRQLRARWPHVHIYSMYGLTECKRVSYLPPDEIDRRPESVGRAMPNTEAYIVDDEGRRVAPGQVGELVIRGGHVMLGYWEAPEETARVLRPGLLPGERVLHSGDLFRADEDGYLYFVGRRDDLIKTRGQRVSPREVEEVLHRLPGVAEAAVVGVPDEVLGTAIKAVVRPVEGAQLDAQAVLRHCAQHLEDHLVPTIVEFRAELPRTETGKVSKRELSTLP